MRWVTKLMIQIPIQNFELDEFVLFFMHFSPGTMTTQTEAINSDLQTFMTHIIERRTEADSH